MVRKFIPVFLITGFGFAGWANSSGTQNRWELTCRPAQPKTKSMQDFCDRINALPPEPRDMRDTVGNRGLAFMEQCSADQGSGYSDAGCAEKFGYGLRNPEASVEIPGIKGNAKGKKTDPQCPAGDSECSTMEVFFTNFGISRSASHIAILNGLGTLGTPEAKAAQQDYLRRNPHLTRQINCAAEQTDFFEGQCARTVSVDDIRGEPYRGKATEFFEKEFFGLGAEGLHNIDLSQSILAAFNKCAEAGNSAERCELQADMFKSKNLTDGELLKNGVTGSIYVPSDSFLNAVGNISKKHKLDDETGREAFVRKLNQEFAGEIIPKLIEESKLAMLHEQVKDDESRRKYCVDAGKLGVKPPSTEKSCQDAYYDAYVASPNKDPEIDTSDRDAFFAEMNKGLGRTLTGEDVGLPELAEAHGAFAAIRELSLIEARNNPDIFRQATLYAGGTPIKATNLANEAARTGTPNPRVQNYAETSGSGDGGFGLLARSGDMIDGDADSDNGSSGSGGSLESRVSKSLPPAQRSDVRPEGEGAVDPVVSAKLQLGERGSGAILSGNPYDNYEDYLSASAMDRAAMPDGLHHFMLQLTVDRTTGGVKPMDVHNYVSQTPSVP